MIICDRFEQTYFQNHISSYEPFATHIKVSCNRHVKNNDEFTAWNADNINSKTVFKYVIIIGVIMSGMAEQTIERCHRVKGHCPGSAGVVLVSAVFGIRILYSPNTLRPRQNGRHYADDIFKCIFLNEHVWFPIKISLKFFPKGQINKIPALVKIMAWRRPGAKPLSEPMMVNLTTHICVIRPQWVKLVVLVVSRVSHFIMSVESWFQVWCCRSDWGIRN